MCDKENMTNQPVFTSKPLEDASRIPATSKHPTSNTHPAASAPDPRESAESIRIGKALLVPTILFALFVASLEYDTYSLLGVNHCGLSTLLITIAGLVYYTVIMKRLNRPIKRTGILYIIAIALLGLATFLSDDVLMALINKYACIALSISLLINTLVDDSLWGILEHVLNWFRALGGSISFLSSPVKDIKALKASKPAREGRSNAFYVCVGLGVSIPLLIVIMGLLCSADAVFAQLAERFVPDFRIANWISMAFIALYVFFSLYSVIRFILSPQKNLGLVERKQYNAIIAITVSILISIVYGAFSLIQVIYLFGKYTLPAGYTYASYAKEGVFQLMWLSILNLAIVVCGIAFFEKSRLLKGLLTFISACTYMMIGSSSYRLWQYVNICHGLTRKRLWGIWGLLTVSICFAGVLVFIYRSNFKLYRFGMITIVTTYLILALLKPDLIIAKVNLDVLPNVISSSCDYELLDSLGLDALPVMQEHDPNWIYNRGFYEYSYYGKASTGPMDWRTLNLSDLRGRITSRR